jgi:hypothetical protein
MPIDLNRKFRALEVRNTTKEERTLENKPKFLFLITVYYKKHLEVVGYASHFLT